MQPGVSGGPGGSAPTTTGGNTGSVMSPIPGAPVGAGQPPVSEAAAPPVYDWTMFGYDLGNTRNNVSETKLSVATVAGLQKRWTTRAGSGNGGLTSTPLVVDGTLYVCEHPGPLSAYTASTGVLKWSKSGLGRVRCGTPLVTEDRVYVSVGDALHAHNREDGAEIWVKNYMVTLTLTDGSPIQAGDKIVVGVGTYQVINSGPYTAKGIIVAFNKDGSEAWRVVPAGDDTTGISVWSSPAIDTKRGVLYIGTGQAYQQPAGPNSDAIMAIDYNTGEVKWVNQFHMGDVYTDAIGGMDWDIGAAPNLFQVKGVDAVGAGSKGALWRAVNRDTGETLWEKNLGNPSALGGVMAAAAVADGRIFVAHKLSGSLNGGTSELIALNMDDGTPAWPAPVAMPAFTWGGITHANGVVYTSIQNGSVFALDAKDGKQLWTTRLANGCAGGPTISNGWLYVPSGYTGLGPNTSGADLNAFSLEGDDGGPPPPPPAGGMPPPEKQGGPAFMKAMDALRNNHGCIGGFCHGDSGGLNLQATPEEQYKALVGADKMGAPTGDSTTTGMCSGRKRVVPGDAAASVLFQKVSGMPMCGEPMPTSGSGIMGLSTDEVESVRAWIADGAKFE
jgi:polyvinyl alcohol dehydrogenase (cytochrome)